MRATTGTSQGDPCNAVLSACTEASRAALVEKGTVRQFEPEEPLYQEGEPAGWSSFPSPAACSSARQPNADDGRCCAI